MGESRRAGTLGDCTLSTNADIIDLCNFYATPLGMAAGRSISLSLSPIWRPISQERLLGLGYATPYLSRFGADCERSLAFMPAAQGAERWPAGAPLRTALVGIEDLPLGDSSIDRILMVHALEFAENPAYIEMYRRGNAYHPAHPFFMWYWGENGRQHIGKVIVAGAENAHIPEILGWERADNLTEAIAMARSYMGRNAEISMLHQPVIGLCEVTD